MFDLTIAIPTFNRSRHLEKLLEKLLPACVDKKVEVLVSDNASTDGTREMLNKFKRRNFFRILRNDKNLGFDRNILKLLDEAQGRFVWLFADDDELDFSFFDQIINLVKTKSQIGVFFLDSIYRNELKHQKPASRLITKEISQQEYLDKYLHKATLITLNIINVRYYRDIKLDPDCVSREWIHVQVLINMAQRLNEQKKKNLVVLNKVIFPAVGNTHYSPEHFWDLFVNQFAFTVDRSAQGLALKRFKKNFYSLNIRRRFLGLAKDFSGRRVVDIYRPVIKYFYPPVFDRVLFWLSIVGFKLFGYSTLKKLKDFIVGNK